MNILFLGPYRQNDEWGYKSQSILTALKRTQHTITSRPIYMSSVIHNYNNYIESAESVNVDSYDILIQFVLPSFAIYQGDFKKRIGIFHTETIPQHIPMGELTYEYLMDEIWVESKLVASNLENVMSKHNYNTKIQVMPPCVNLEQFDLNTSHKSIRTTSPNLQDKFIFYYIGNILESKSGFQEMYTAYLHAFNMTDPVALLLGLNTTLTDQHIEQYLRDCRKTVSFAKPPTDYPQVHIVNPEQGVLSLHEKRAIYSDCDCMIDLSYTMTIPSTVLASALYHNTPIVNHNSASYEWLSDNNIWCVDSYEDICSYPKQHNIYRFTSQESWYKPITKSVVETMQEAYVNKFKRDKKRKENAKLRQQFQDLSLDNLISI